MPYPTRLYWEHDHGVATFNGLRRMLDTAPIIEGIEPYDMLDWVPGVVEMIQPRGYGRRDITSNERLCIKRWLEQMRGLWWTQPRTGP